MTLVNYENYAAYYKGLITIIIYVLLPVVALKTHYRILFVVKPV